MARSLSSAATEQYAGAGDSVARRPAVVSARYLASKQVIEKSLATHFLTISGVPDLEPKLETGCGVFVTKYN